MMALFSFMFDSPYDKTALLVMLVGLLLNFIVDVTVKNKEKAAEPSNG